MIDKIFLLNLERRNDKLCNMLKKIQNFNYIETKLEIITAIDGKNISNEYLDKNSIKINNWFNPYSGNSITYGEIGCALSHNKMWNMIVDNKYNKVLILEDDVDIDLNFETKLNNYMDQIDKNKIIYDLLYLSRKSFSEDLKIISENIKIPSFSYWTCGYILTYEGALKLLNSNYLSNLIPVDEFLPLCYLNNEKKLEIYNFKINNFVALVAEPYIIKPELNAFQKSDTEISNSYLSNKLWINYKNINFQVITVATKKVDGYIRFINSCKKYNIPYITLGLGIEWEGNDMSKGMGGGHKINLLKEYLNNFSTNELRNKIILFTDSYDVIINGNSLEILDKFINFDCDILFSAEIYCWPDNNLKNKYSDVDSEFKYLNSGGIIGYADKFKELIKYNINNSDDDQLYYTNNYLNIIYNHNLKLKLDHNCEIFQALQGIFYYIDIDFAKSKIINNLTNTNPILIHGNGGIRSKLFLNSLSNYIPLVWRETYLYQDLSINNDLFKNLLYEYYFKIKIIYIIENDKNIENVNNLITLKYPKNKINLIIINFSKNNISYIFNNDIINQYSDFKEYSESDNKNQKIINYIRNNLIFDESDYLFILDNNLVIENNKIIQKLIIKNKDIISPLLKKKNTSFSNFWGEINNDGYYKRSFDYFDIIDNKKRGCWNVPYISFPILINKNKYNEIFELLCKNIIDEDFDMYLCRLIREKNIFMYTSNLENYGYLI